MAAGYYAGIGAVAVLVAAMSCSNPERKTEFRAPSQYQVQERGIEQVFRDYDGWRVLYTDERGEVQERQHETRHMTDPCIQQYLAPQIPESGLRGLGSRKAVGIYRVPGVQEPIEKTLHYTMPTPRARLECKYVEIHLPADYRISPGVGTSGGKVPQPAAIAEVR